mmetsp:Transcript_12818/g.33597  ORF Transcript_12818/g.33597 Transcript_12818/m.33597 type:complete len:298 (+) Transcript_12818:47-940(+)
MHLTRSTTNGLARELRSALTQHSRLKHPYRAAAQNTPRRCERATRHTAQQLCSVHTSVSSYLDLPSYHVLPRPHVRIMCGTLALRMAPAPSQPSPTALCTAGSPDRFAVRRRTRPREPQQPQHKRRLAPSPKCGRLCRPRPVARATRRPSLTLMPDAAPRRRHPPQTERAHSIDRAGSRPHPLALPRHSTPRSHVPHACRSPPPLPPLGALPAGAGRPAPHARAPQLRCPARSGPPPRGPQQARAARARRPSLWSRRLWTTWPARCPPRRRAHVARRRRAACGAATSRACAGRAASP